MQVTVESAGPATAKISFTVPAEEFQQEVRAGLRQVAGRVRMKGFRPGKVPGHVLEKQFGEQVRRDVAEHFLRKAYQQALQEQDLKPISHPRVAPEALEPGDDGSLALDFEVSLKPEFELPEYKGVRIESELEPVLEEQVSATIEDLRRQESVPQPAGDEGIGEDGVIVADVTFEHEGETVFEREGLRLGAHTPPPGVEPEAFREALAGAVEGAELELEMLVPPTVEKEAAHGQPGTCRMAVRQAFQMVPPPDEELFAKLDAKDADEMRAKVRERMQEVAEQRERGRIENALLDRLIEGTDLGLPESLLEEQTEHRLHQLHQQLEQQGVPHDQIHEQIEQQRATAREEADRGLRALLVVEAIGEAEGLLVTDEELDTELGRIAERNQVAVDEVRRYYVENNLTQQLAVEILERKVRKFLRENADVSEPS